MAAALRVTATNPVEGILDFCRQRVQTILHSLADNCGIDGLERALCESLNLSVREVWSQQDVDALVEELARREREPQFGALPMELEGDCYGVLMRRAKRTAKGHLRYVAVIDCRGKKANRRFFTRWHEIAHCLTYFQQSELVFHRITEAKIQRDPIERLMDMIAGEIGFFNPIFLPILESELQNGGTFSVDTVERVRKRYAADASFQATLNACATRVRIPLIVLEAAAKYKKDEERELRSSDRALFPGFEPQPKLRVVRSIPNPAAKNSGIFFIPNMRIPESSTIYETFRTGLSTTAFEDLADWSTSDGSKLKSVRVRIDARMCSDSAIAIISPQ